MFFKMRLTKAKIPAEAKAEKVERFVQSNGYGSAFSAGGDGKTMTGGRFAVAI